MATKNENNSKERILSKAEKKRVFIECTSTFISGGNTGVQRVVRNIVNNSMRLQVDEADAIPIIWTGRGFFRLKARLGVKPHIMVRIKDMIARVLYLILKDKPGEPLKFIFRIAELLLPEKARIAAGRSRSATT